MKLLFALLLLMSAPAWCDNYIVSFKPTMLQQNLFSQIDQLNQSIMKKAQDFNFMVANPMEEALQVKFAYKAIRSFSANLTPEQIVILRQLPLQLTQVGTKHLLGNPTPNGTYTYGLTNIHVPELKAEHPNINGAGVIVGSIDTGIDPTHPDLIGRVLAFKDFVNGKPDAYDDQGHGSHTCGTISGGNASGTQIGVAPGVRIVSAKVFDQSGGATDDIILAAMQWIMDYDGQGHHPAVVSNSWGGRQNPSHDLADEPMHKMTMAWVQANMVPVFAAGNEGPDVGSVGTPGGYPEVIAVGAVDSSNNVADFSSRGPIQWKKDGLDVPVSKPDIMAPGVSVYSSLPGPAYASWDGTSMATPHVTGVVALMLQANPKLSVAQVKDILARNAQAIGSDRNTYGAGLVDAKASVDAALSLK
jgi:subtilisin family serine protease